jgi:uncharacterized membrane protein YccC
MQKTASALWHELNELLAPGPRWRICAMASLTVVISTVLALALHLDNVWWAGISGFMSTQATRPSSIQRSILRVVGTASGAVLGFVMTPFMAYDHVAGCLFMFCLAFVGSLGVLVSPHGYAWLFCGITANLVAMMSLDNPTSALNLAVYRLLEVSLGSVVAVLVATVLASDDPGTAPPPAPGWSDLLGKNWQAVLHAFRAALTIMLLPLVWSWLDLPSLSQMIVTVAAVMAVPSLSSDPHETAQIVIQRGFHRLLGCFLGGLAALVFLATSMTQLLPWLAVLGAGVWVCCHVQASTRGVSYVGTQAAVVYVITLVQGWTPPDSIWPGIDRLAGMAGGLTILLIVTALIWPDAEQVESGGDVLPMKIGETSKN